MKTPHHLALKLFRWFCHPDLFDPIEGDLIELYEERIAEKGKVWAYLRLWWDVLLLLRPSLAKRWELDRRYQWMGILSVNFSLARRGLLKHRQYTTINILSMMITAFVLIAISAYVTTENRIDSVYQDSNQKYRITTTTTGPDMESIYSSQTTYGLGPAVKENLSQVKNFVRIRPMHYEEGPAMSNKDRSRLHFEYNAYYVEKSFFEFFNIPLDVGNAATALADDYSVVLSRKAATKYFGMENPVGEELIVEGGNLSGVFTVTGVLDNERYKTHLDFEMLIPIDFLLSNYGLYQREEGWGWENFYTYVELQDQANRVDFIEGTKDILMEHFGEDLQSAQRTLEVSLQPVSSIYFATPIDGEAGLHKGSLRTVNTLIGIGVALLLITFINYLLLSIAKATVRKKLIAVQQYMGANRASIGTQFMMESLLQMVAALTCAVLLYVALGSRLGELLGLPLQHALLLAPRFWLITGAVLLLIAGCTIIQPLLQLRYVSLVQRTDTRRSGGSWMGKGLLVIQLVTALLLISATFLVFGQLNFMQEKETGIPMDQILVMQGPRVVIGEEGHEVFNRKHQLFKQRLEENATIDAVSGSTNVPGTGEIWYGGMYRLGDEKQAQVVGQAVLVDHAFTSVFDFEFLAGSPFTKDMPDYSAVIINEQAVKAYNLGTPQEAIDQQLIMANVDTLRIQGVIKDVHWNSLHDANAPLIFGIVDMFNAFVSIKISTSNLQETLSLIEATYRDLYPHDPYTTFFLDDDFNQQYASEVLYGKILTTFALLAVFISSLGLFAFISFAMSQRVKEIGIRKVLGASQQQLLRTLSQNYLTVLLVAVAIATPTVYVLGTQWLDSFAYRIPLTTTLLALPVLIASSCFLIVVWQRIVVATRVNPVEQLRDE